MLFGRKVRQNSAYSENFDQVLAFAESYHVFYSM